MSRPSPDNSSEWPTSEGAAEEERQDSPPVSIPRMQRFIERLTLAFASGCVGVVLWKALFPAFYYMQWLFFLIMLWGVVSLGYLCGALALSAVARLRGGTQCSSSTDGLGFTLGMLVVVSLLVVFKVPLHASFLVAKPGFEEALADHHDDLAQVGRVHHNFGLFQISKAYRGCRHGDGECPRSSQNKNRVFFQFRDDSEAAIIYSENGVSELCYNSGSKGHLFGNWYWMKED